MLANRRWHLPITFDILALNFSVSFNICEFKINYENAPEGLPGGLSARIVLLFP
jgi:hypothetical protein